MRFLPLLAALALGCTSEIRGPIGEASEGPPQRGGVFRAATFANLRSLDAAVAFDTVAAAIEQLIYDRLVDYERGGRELEPQLAETIDVSEDGRTYTFTLRRGVRFHDGNELRAADVKRSIERAFHEKTPCPVASYYSMITGQKAFRAGKAKEITGIRVEGDYTVVIQLDRPSAVFLHLMALPIVAPVCRSAGTTYDRNFSTQACGTGAFKLEKFETGEMVRVVRHEGYWVKGEPYLDAIEWTLGMQGFTQRLKFEDGALDYMREFNATDSILYRTDARWKGLGAWESPMTMWGVFMNTEMPPFDNAHVRRAVSYALDREQLEFVRPGHIVPQYKVVPESIIESTPGYPRQTHDVDKALEQMKLAGLAFDPKTGEGGYPREIRYMTGLDSFGQTSGEVFQQQLARIGIRIRLDLVSFPTFLAKTGRRKTVAMGTAGWHADYPEASTFFGPLFTTGAIDPESSQNKSFYSNPQVDEWVEQADRMLDPQARAEMYRKIETVLAEDAPWAMTHASRLFELWHPYVHGYRPHPVHTQAVRHVWLDRQQQKLARASRRNQCWQPVPGATRCAPSRRPRTTLALITGAR